MMRKIVSGYLAIVLIGSVPSCSAAAESPAGEIFGVAVSQGNYHFAKYVVTHYGAKWRGTPQTEQELEQLVWRELIFSYEAFRRGIEASSAEVDAEIEKLLAEQKVDFNWRLDKERFSEWTQNTLGVPIDVFRNQMEHLVKLEKLRQQIVSGFKPEVTEAEAYQKFLNEYNTLAVELVQFDERPAAERFYQRIIAPSEPAAAEELPWRDLARCIDAQEQGVILSPEEREQGLKDMLFPFFLPFNYQKDQDRFREWIGRQTGMTPDEFFHAVDYVVLADKVVRENVAAGVPDPAMRTELRTLRDTTGGAPQMCAVLLQRYSPEGPPAWPFADYTAARKFYRDMNRSADVWQSDRRQKPTDFKRPGFVAVDFLVNMWGFTQADADNMLMRNAGDFYPPAPIYRGYGVFHVLRIRRAEPEQFVPHRNDYLEKVKQIKQQEEYRRWVEKLVLDAKVNAYVP